MSAAPRAAAAFSLVMAAAAHGAGEEAGAKGDAAASKPAWEFAITVYPTDVRGGENYTSAIAMADRGPVHLEARYGYESPDARSVFAGWTFSGGETVTWELTPLVGGAWGTIRAFVPGFEASVAWKRLDFYIEGEYVRDKRAHADSYFYAWSELGVRPVEWLRVGLVGQRTRAYGGDREFQRGPFAQVTWGSATLGAFWFNPGSSEQVLVGSIGVSF